MTRTIARAAGWGGYYVAALILAAVLVRPEMVEAHGGGCCQEPCTIHQLCVGGCVGCPNVDEEQYEYWMESCSHCVVYICFIYTMNDPFDPTCYICCNDDWADCR